MGDLRSAHGACSPLQFRVIAKFEIAIDVRLKHKYYLYNQVADASCDMENKNNTL